MRFQFGLKEKVIECLSEKPEKQFTAREIAEWICEKHPKDCKEKQKASKATRHPTNTKRGLLDQIMREICATRRKLEKNDLGIRTTDDNPIKYYYTKSKSDKKVDITDTTASKGNIKEEKLYPKLIEYLRLEHAIHSKRIDEKKIRGTKEPKGTNTWVYPDIVGVKDLTDNWDCETKKCAAKSPCNRVTLWSFEVKRGVITGSTIRKAFFQAVSNSSWANYGYLVANGIDDRLTTKDELSMLSNLYGIGFIELNSTEPMRSKIIFPAREKPEIDWDVANKLVEKNKDFLEYMQSIRRFYETGDIIPEDWDAKNIEE